MVNAKREPSPGGPSWAFREHFPERSKRGSRVSKAEKRQEHAAGIRLSKCPVMKLHDVFREPQFFVTRPGSQDLLRAVGRGLDFPCGMQNDPICFQIDHPNGGEF